MAVPSYWRAIPQRYRYEANECVSCGKKFFPPRQICDQCQSREFKKIKLGREGKVLTYTIIRVAPSQFVDQAPYPIAIVELNDGVKVLMQIADCDPETIEIGMPVRMEFRKVSTEGDAGIINYGYKAVPVKR